MGYAFVLCSCIVCNDPIAVNPHKVPSIRVRRDEEGKLVEDLESPRQPLCRRCAEALNDRFEAQGLPRVPIQPDAYEPIHESQL